MIDKKIILRFFLDRMQFTACYFINCILIILFYSFSIGRTVEILYPACISIFVYLIFMILNGAKYYNYNNKIRDSVNNPFYNLKAYTFEQREAAGAISELHKKYIEKTNSIELHNKDNKRFIAQWIHSMKNPASVIDLIIQKSLAGDIMPLKGIQEIKHENGRLLHSLEQILNIFRLDDFAMDYEPESVDLKESIRKIINSFKNDFVYNNVFPRIQGDENSIMVLTDRKWNESMIAQLVSNAIKYSKVQNEAKNIYFIFNSDGNKASLTIKDEGVGIPEYDLKKIFEPFFTGENGRKFENATGIGLYFCREVINRLGHEIAIKSKIGEYTEVTVTYLSKM